MIEYWDSRFKEEGSMWKFEPSDSAIIALDLFKSNGINKILIPGFGYGRNAKLFYDNGVNVTGIEISKSAIDLAKSNGLDCLIHHGSVVLMPFDSEQYNGIFCYALLHLLNKTERRNFLKSCFNQLKSGGLMIFTVVSKQANMFGNGKLLSKDRFQIMKGLNVFFYDSESINKEFADVGLLEFKDIDEPIKHMIGQEPLKCKFVICRKD
ncbi:MAG: class I SAM-dependent methyltransferase [Bacteroidales bacterium]|nr:class I SAM-dependent methyltransferase [Bacteroidales bacterium]